MAVKESVVYEQLADWMNLQYPGVLYRFDVGADVYVPPAVANKFKRLHPRRGHPDMFIAEPQFIYEELKEERVYTHSLPTIKIDPEATYALTGFAGLYLELKKEGETLSPGDRAKKRYKSKDGLEYKTEHLMEQADYLYDLRNKGYKAEFAIGFDDAVKQIRDYLGEPHKEKVEF